MTREERIKNLKNRIDEFVKSGGDIQDKKDNIPYYSYITKVIFLDKKEGINSTIASIYKECGYDYVDKGNPLDLKRIKKEIDEFVKNGGDIQDKKDNIPYYKLIIYYLKKQKRLGNDMTMIDVYKKCGYDLKKKYYNELDYLAIVNKYKDEKGYVDNLKEINPNLLRKLLLRKDACFDYNQYLISFYGVRLKESFSSVDYVELVEEGLKEFERLYGRDSVTIGNLKTKNINLYTRVRHLAIYFPYGSTTPSGVLAFFGYDVEVVDKEIDEDVVLKYLEENFKDKKIKNIIDLPIYSKIIKVSAYNDQSVEQYLHSKGYEFKTTNNAYRLSKAMIESDDEIYYEIIKYRKSLLEANEILNSNDYSEQVKNEEFKRIGKIVMNKYENLIKEKKSNVKR